VLVCLRVSIRVLIYTQALDNNNVKSLSDLLTMQISEHKEAVVV